MLFNMNCASIFGFSRGETHNLSFLGTTTNWSRTKRKQIYVLIKIASLVGIKKTKEMNISASGVENAHVSGAPKVAQHAFSSLPMILMRFLIENSQH
jgi:hypothetical protein